ncbi:peptidoglycan bridge formation glycyltransferase FemA/FemB family protein [Patescibacteria group bacterium]|nr:MAG: peptidoglycan bridge formation glycyltransferase FemA/FemB family protein [Patescibacteria group bacterium]
MQMRVVENSANWPQNLPFSQSWEWGDILIAEGKKVERLEIEENGAVLAWAQIVYVDLPFGWKYAFCPKGPVGISNFPFSERSEAFPISNCHSERSEESLDETYKTLIDYLKSKKCVFFRVEPEQVPEGANKTIDITPRATLILDLIKSEDELLAGMGQKTRYNINLAARKNLRIANEKNADVFIKLEKETAKRDNFKTHPEEHYKKVISSDFVYQLTAYHENAPVASAVFVGFGGTFTYLYGASDYACRHLMAPYLLQWEGIKLGKKLGYKFYDFFGIAPQGEPRHQYAGVTRFKLGFGGAYKEAPGTFDLIINKKKCKVYGWLRKLRRIF